VTTIAWDGRVLAADGKSVSESGCIRTLRARKLRLIMPERPGLRPFRRSNLVTAEATVVASTGVREEADAYMDWLERVDGDPDAKWLFPTGKGEWETDGVEIRCAVEFDGEIMTSRPVTLKGRSPTGRLVEIGDPGDHVRPWSMGSGSTFAEGAMAAGAGAVKAVMIASRLDCNTGGVILYVDTYRLDLGVQTAEAA
jgi:hypothetical protein